MRGPNPESLYRRAVLTVHLAGVMAKLVSVAVPFRYAAMPGRRWANVSVPDKHQATLDRCCDMASASVWANISP